MDIPVLNLYYLLLYAWDRLEEGRVVAVGGLEHRTTADLLARILVKGTRHVLRRGLDRGYVEHFETTSRLRGRVAFAPSVRRMLLPQARAVCTFDELTPDVLTNRILRTTIGRLMRVDALSDQHRRDLRGVYRELGGVGEIHLTRASFKRVRLHAGNAFYRFLLSACALAHENLFPRDDGQGYHFRDFARDDTQMARLFEAFLLRFYQRERPDLTARPESMAWIAEPISTLGPGQLPGMRTDVTLRGADWTCVIDAKYYRAALSRWHEDGTFDASNLYQITAYLRTLESNGGADGGADGVLLYPVVEGTFDHTYRVGPHRVRLLTLDLTRPWPEIESTLLDLASWSELSPSSANPLEAPF
ncbi:MAG: hypothetical protein ABJF88_11220 [Rhodothermales bacterium]